MKAHLENTELFPAFVQAEAREGQQRRAAERERRLAQHREHLALCWSDWQGPVANGAGTSGFCEVNTLDAFSLTHGERRYHYMAPCRIESVSPDGLTIIAVVEYQRPCPCADLYNGERLRLDLTEVWPPVSLLSAQRHEQQTSATTSTAAPQPLGTVPLPTHPWDTGERGPAGSSKDGKAVLRCPHCQVTFYERRTCPSCGKAPTLNPANP